MSSPSLSEILSYAHLSPQRGLDQEHYYRCCQMKTLVSWKVPQRYHIWRHSCMLLLDPAIPDVVFAKALTQCSRGSTSNFKFIFPLSHPFYKCLLSTYYMLCPCVRLCDTQMDKPQSFPLYTRMCTCTLTIEFDHCFGSLETRWKGA